MAHGDTWGGKWRRNWRMEWVASTLHTTSEHGVSSITTADAHTSVASSRLNWRPPAYLNGLVRFAERRNVVSACVPSHFNWPLLHDACFKPGSLYPEFPENKMPTTQCHVACDDIWNKTSLNPFRCKAELRRFLANRERQLSTTDTVLNDHIIDHTVSMLAVLLSQD